MNTEKRQHERVPFLAVVDLADSIRACEGDIVDVSFGGMQIERIPNALLKDLPKKFTGIVTHRGKTAKVQLAAKWYKKDISGRYATVGFQVIQNLQGWQSFVKESTNIISEKEDYFVDVWGNSESKYMRVTN